MLVLTNSIVSIKRYISIIPVKYAKTHYYDVESVTQLLETIQFNDSSYMQLPYVFFHRLMSIIIKYIQRKFR